MRKRVFGILVVASLLVSLFAVPVAAQEVTDPNKVIKEETFNANEDLLIKDFKNAQTQRCDNYIKYLDGVIYNLNETVRIKQEVVTNYKWLAQYNPYYNTLIPQAERDLAQAKAWVAYYQQYKEAVKADFKVRY